MEGLSQSQTNHVRHLKAFVASQVFNNLPLFKHKYFLWQGWILCASSPSDAGSQQRAQQVTILFPTYPVYFLLTVTPWLARTWCGPPWWGSLARGCRATAWRARGTSWPPSASPRPRPASPRTPMCFNSPWTYSITASLKSHHPSLTVCTFWNFRAPYVDTPQGGFRGWPFVAKC